MACRTGPTLSLVLLIGAALALTARAADAPPPKTTGDEEIDFLLKSARPAAPAAASNAATSKPASRPTSGPTTRPAGGGGDAPATSPFKDPADFTGARQAVITLSDGEKVRGKFWTTLDAPMRVFDPKSKEYVDVPYALIKTIEAKVLWERDQPEWRFKESGSDIKEFTGKTYPARETEYTFTLINGQTVSGSVAAPLYYKTPNGQRLLVLHKRDKGDVGKKLKDLVYVQKVEFAEE